VIAEPALRWIVTVAFAAAGIVCALRCVRQGPVHCRVSDVLHALMCAAMIAMAWPAGMDLPRIPQLVLFAVATAWFAGMLAAGATGHGGRWSLGHHTLMMAGMAWMLFVMPAVMAGMTVHDAASGGGHDHHAGGAAVTMNSPAHVVVVAVVLAVVFLVAGTAWLARAFDTARDEEAPRLPAAGLAANGVMSLGMAVMAVLLV
jgi:hypothetical protein